MKRTWPIGGAIMLAMLGAPLASMAAHATPAPAQGAAPVFPGTSRIGLVPPPGMTPSATFAGFEHVSGASILLVDLPDEAYAQIAARFTPADLAPTGFIMAGDAEALTLFDGEGLLARGTQRVQGVTFRKWVTIRRQQGMTAMVTIQIPDGTDALSDEAVEAALASIAIRPAATLEDQRAALPYRIGDLAGFRIVRSLAGNSLLLTDGPRDSDPDGDQPMVVIAPSLGAVWTAGDELAFARKAVADLRQLDAVTITTEQRLDRSPVIVTRLRGQARDATSGRGLVFSQVMRFRDDAYLRVIAMAPPDRSEALARAERLADSLSMRDAAVDTERAP